MVYRITHVTEYLYAAPVSASHNLAHLLPASNGRQRCLDSDLELDPGPRAVRHFRDYFGNTATYFELARPHQRMRLTVVSRVDVTADPPALDPRPWMEVLEAFCGATDERSLLAREFLLPSPFLPLLAEARAYAEPSFKAGAPLSECLKHLMHRIHDEFRYVSGATSIATPLGEVFARREGVCQDFAHVMIACLRAMGLPACYLSGYLETRPPPGQPRLVGADASHAWVGIYAPGTGWMELDPTNDIVPGMRHVRLAKGRDYGDVAPLRGTLYGGGEHTLTVSVDVCPI
jgi:transglutaminase-like putative cysteine protease